MFSGNLKYYRLKKKISQKELAASADVTPMSISYYESGERRPSMEVTERLAHALGVRVSDFLADRNENLVFAYGDFQKNSGLSKKQQEYIKASVEEYINRLYSVADILGGEALPEPPACHALPVLEDAEENAAALREHLHLADLGPTGNLVDILESRGILVCFCSVESDAFSGMNGTVDDRPFVVINGNMPAERIRSMIANEMAHILFNWPDGMEKKEIKSMAAAVSGAFLFSQVDALRELGIRRSAVTKDMELVCRKYGISMYLLANRAALCGIISRSAEKDFCTKAAQAGRKDKEPVCIGGEEPELLLQLVLRAVCENEISVQKGAELLQEPYESVAEQCFGIWNGEIDCAPEFMYENSCKYKEPEAMI